MKIKRLLSLIITFTLILGTVSVNAATQIASTASEPWVLSHVESYEDAHVGAYASIAHHPRTGKAYISYYDENSTALKMAHEVSPGTGNCGPGNSWQCETIQSSDSVGRYSSIDVTYVTQNPVILSYTKIGISYYDASKQRLRYAECSISILNPDCAWVAYNVDDSSDVKISVGKHSSLAFDANAVPHISYSMSYDAVELPFIDQSGVKFATYVGATAGDCIEGGSWDCEFVDYGYNSLEFGAQSSLDFNMLGWPIISFYEAEHSALSMAIGEPGEGPECENADWSCYIVDNTSDVGRFSSLHAQKNIDDKYMIAYYDSTNRKVKFAEWVGPGGHCTSPQFDCYAVDQTTDVYPPNFDPLSMDVDTQGYPIIAYMNSATETSPDYLKVARPAQAFGYDEGNCGEARPDELMQYWECRTVDPPHTDVGLGAFVSVSVNSTGLASIAYSDQNLRDNEMYLKVAQQRFGIYLPMIRK